MEFQEDTRDVLGELHQLEFINPKQCILFPHLAGLVNIKESSAQLKKFASEHGEEVYDDSNVLTVPTAIQQPVLKVPAA